MQRAAFHLLVVLTGIALVGFCACNDGDSRSGIGPLVPAGTQSGGGSSSASSGSTSGTTGSQTGSSTGTQTPSSPKYKIAGWAPYWDTANVEATIKRELSTLDMVHFFWYYTRADGTIAAKSAVDPALVATVQQSGTLVVPTVTDAFAKGRAEAIFSDPSLRAAHMTALLDLVDKNGYDGLDLDYEAMSLSTRDLFSAFVEDLSIELHARGKILTVAVYGKTSSPGGWSGPKSHDYGRLAAAVDRLNIMGYGYGYSGGPPNPIGPIFWLDKVLAFATSVASPDKVVLGVNFYGRDWPDGQNGKALTSPQVASLLQTYNPRVSYDSNDGESTFTYTKNGVNHTVWYHSPIGMADKMKLVTKYGLGGIAIWRLGSEDPALFDAIRNELRRSTP